MKWYFPGNTPRFVLDAFAHSSLWKVGLDYHHGTGHGVGTALNVHEGPQSISFRFGNMTPLLKGMIISNEPGYYEDHAFGIQIENLLFVERLTLLIVLEGLHMLDSRSLLLFRYRFRRWWRDLHVSGFGITHVRPVVKR